MVSRRYRISDPNGIKKGLRPAAVALAYSPEKDLAPRVVASGSGKIAEQIVALARQHDIPLYEDPALAAALATVNLGDEIPPELYLVVAEVLAYIFRMMGKMRRTG
jgi:flagellar biosynthesis protein